VKSDIVPFAFSPINTRIHLSKSVKLLNRTVDLVKSVTASNHLFCFRYSSRTFSTILSLLLGGHINRAFAPASLAISKNICLCAISISLACSMNISASFS
jgi:hypothetical protein